MIADGYSGIDNWRIPDPNEPLAAPPIWGGGVRALPRQPLNTNAMSPYGSIGYDPRELQTGGSSGGQYSIVNPGENGWIEQFNGNPATHSKRVTLNGRNYWRTAMPWSDFIGSAKGSGAQAANSYTQDGDFGQIEHPEYGYLVPEDIAGPILNELGQMQAQKSASDPWNGSLPFMLALAAGGLVAGPSMLAGGLEGYPGINTAADLAGTASGTTNALAVGDAGAWGVNPRGDAAWQEINRLYGGQPTNAVLPPTQQYGIPPGGSTAAQGLTGGGNDAPTINGYGNNTAQYESSGLSNRYDALNQQYGGGNALANRFDALNQQYGGTSNGSWFGSLLNSPTALLQAGSIASGLLASGQAASTQADAARAAAAAQLQASGQANALQEKIYNQTRADLEPWRLSGVNALAKLNSGNVMGQDPGYGFRLSEGLKSLERSAAARGGLLSGSALKGITRYGQDYASNEYGNAFNRQASIAGLGQTATNQIGNVGQNYANTVGNNYMTGAQGAGNYGTQAANAQASGYIGAANALSGGINNAMNAYSQNQLLSRLIPGYQGIY